MQGIATIIEVVEREHVQPLECYENCDPKYVETNNQFYAEFILRLN